MEAKKTATNQSHQQANNEEAKFLRSFMPVGNLRIFDPAKRLHDETSEFK